LVAYTYLVLGFSLNFNGDVSVLIDFIYIFLYILLSISLLLALYFLFGLLLYIMVFHIFCVSIYLSITFILMKLASRPFLFLIISVLRLTILCLTIEFYLILNFLKSFYFHTYKLILFTGTLSLTWFLFDWI
jgi:hypothetical protein